MGVLIGLSFRLSSFGSVDTNSVKKRDERSLSLRGVIPSESIRVGCLAGTITDEELRLVLRGRGGDWWVQMKHDETEGNIC